MYTVGQLDADWMYQSQKVQMIMIPPSLINAYQQKKYPNVVHLLENAALDSSHFNQTQEELAEQFVLRIR